MEWVVNSVWLNSEWFYLVHSPRRTTCKLSAHNLTSPSILPGTEVVRVSITSDHIFRRSESETPQCGASGIRKTNRLWTLALNDQQFERERERDGIEEENKIRERRWGGEERRGEEGREKGERGRRKKEREKETSNNANDKGWFSANLIRPQFTLINVLFLSLIFSLKKKSSVQRIALQLIHSFTHSFIGL